MCYQKIYYLKRWSEKRYHKKAPIFQGSENFIFRLSCIRFSTHSRNETGITNFKRFSSRGVFVNWLKMNDALMLP